LGNQAPVRVIRNQLLSAQQEGILGINHGLTVEEIMADPYVGVLLDRRVIVDINRLDTYFQELGNRIKVDSERGQNV
jgi:hypothetical protein